MEIKDNIRITILSIALTGIHSPLLAAEAAIMPTPEKKPDVAQNAVEEVLYGKNTVKTDVPPGFEDIFNARQNSIVDVVYGGSSIGSVPVEYDHQQVKLTSPATLLDHITAEDMPALAISRQMLLEKLSVPLARVSKQGFASKEILADLDESSSTLHLIFPASLFRSGKNSYDRTFLPQQRHAGFVHSHNINYLSDSSSDSLSILADDTLNLTGGSYIKAAWSYAKDINFNLEELALFLEHNSNRFKLGRQRLNDNLVSSTPSMSYSFFNAINFDGVSMGYMADNYFVQGTGAASPISVYLPQSGSVEVYRNNRLIDIQQFSAGLQYLNTSSWPSGGYDVRLVSKLSNGSKEEKIQPFYKRNGLFRSGELEYLMQMGRYDQHQGELTSHSRREKCRHCLDENWGRGISDNNFASVGLAYTTQSALSLGGGTMVDDGNWYGNASLNIPINSWIAEQLFMDGIIGNNGSTGYQVGINKNFSRFGMNLSYRDNRYRGDKKDFRSSGIVPAYDFNYLQLGLSTFLLWNTSLGVNFGLNNIYQDYGRQNKSQFKTWDVNLSRNVSLSDSVDLRVDLGYHRGVNTLTNRRSRDVTNEDKFFAQFTLGMHERSYNHYQSLYLRSRLNDGGFNKNIYSADYSLDVDNPDFDRGGRYSLNSSLSHGPKGENNGNVGLTVDNNLGYNAVGYSQSFGDSHYNQLYMSQRSGFAIGDGKFAWGPMDNTAALIIDASNLPADHYFEAHNLSTQPIVVKGGHKTVLSLPPYQKISPKAEQIFTGKTDAFYNLNVEAPTTWIRPGQVYNVKVSATRNLTVTGRLYANGKPLANARIVGGNALSDEDGLFVGDFTLKTTEQLSSLNVKKGSQDYVCPLIKDKVTMAQGIMLIQEVNCDVH